MKLKIRSWTPAAAQARFPAGAGAAAQGGAGRHRGGTGGGTGGQPGHPAAPALVHGTAAPGHPRRARVTAPAPSPCARDAQPSGELVLRAVLLEFVCTFPGAEEFSGEALVSLRKWKQMGTLETATKSQVQPG